MKAARSIRPALLIVALPPLLVAATCAGKKGAEKKAPEPTVFLSTGGGSEVRVRVEVARTSEERRIGLMHRQSLDKGSGMIPQDQLTLGNAKRPGKMGGFVWRLERRDPNNIGQSENKQRQAGEATCSSGTNSEHGSIRVLGRRAPPLAP